MFYKYLFIMGIRFVLRSALVAVIFLVVAARRNEEIARDTDIDVLFPQYLDQISILAF